MASNWDSCVWVREISEYDWHAPVRANTDNPHSIKTTVPPILNYWIVDTNLAETL